jgi:hypothetical protein
MRLADGGAAGGRPAVAPEYKPEADVHGPQGAVMVNPRVLAYNTLIGLNRMKVHRTAAVTLVLKNIAMSYPAPIIMAFPASPSTTGTGSSMICTP